MVSRFVSGSLRVVPAAVLAATLGLTGCSAGQVTQTDSIPPAVNGNLGQLGTVLLRDVMIAYPTDGKYEKDGTAPLVLSIVNTGPDDDELTDVTSPAATDVELVGNPKLPAGTKLVVVAPEHDESTVSAHPETTSGAESTESTETTGAEATATSGSAETTTTTGGEATGATGTGAAPTTTTTTTGASSAAEEEPTEIGRISVLLTGLRSGLPIGKTVPVTFYFAKAGQITLDLPIAAPDDAREDATGAPEGGH